MEQDKSDKVIKFVYVFLLGYISLLPFYYFPSVNLAGFNIPIIKYVPFLLILFLWVVSFLTGRRNMKDIVQERINVYIVVYFLLTLFSGIGTRYYSISILKAIYYGITGVLFYFIIYSWRLNLINRLWILRNIVILAFIVSLYGIVTLILGKDVLFGNLRYAKSHVIDPKVFLEMGRISSSLGSPHVIGSFLSAIFPFSIYLHLMKLEQKNISAYLTGTMSITIFIAIVLTFSVGAYISMIFLYIMYQIKIKAFIREPVVDKPIRKLLLLGGILLCVILFMMGANILLSLYGIDYHFDKILGRLDFHKLGNIEGFSHRFRTIKYIPELLGSNFCFGTGIGKLAVGDNIFSITSMDNFYCLSLLENGLIPSMLMLIMFYLIIKKGQKRLGESVPPEERRLVIFLTLSLITFFINMLFWDMFNNPTMRILFWSFAAFLIS